MKRIKTRTIGRIMKLLFIQILVIAGLLVWGKSLYTTAHHRGSDTGNSFESDYRDITPYPTADAAINNSCLVQNKSVTLCSRKV